MVNLNAIFLAIVVLTVLMVLMAAGAIEYLRQIRDAIHQNYEASLVRAMSTTDLKVVPEKEKVVKPCICGHAQTDHARQGNCKICECMDYKPKRGPWPGEVKV